MSSRDIAELIITLGIGCNMVAFGLHQIARPATWLEYIPRLIRWLMPVQPETALRAHGVLNLVLGAWLMSGWMSLLALWASAIWWLSILPLAFMVKWSIALRDVSIICALAALIVLHMA